MQEELFNYKNSIETSITDLVELESKKNNAESELISEIKSLLITKCEEFAKKIEKSERECSEIANLKFKKESEKKEILRAHQRTIEQTTREINLITKDKRSNIMKESKGLYTFRWKHERKTWQYATSPIFFDIGEDYMFQYYDEDTIKKFLKKTSSSNLFHDLESLIQTLIIKKYMKASFLKREGMCWLSLISTYQPNSNTRATISV